MACCGGGGRDKEEKGEMKGKMEREIDSCIEREVGEKDRKR